MKPSIAIHAVRVSGAGRNSATLMLIPYASASYDLNTCPAPAPASSPFA